ncbi:MAG: IPT/TIG domain-containing protein [Bacteroidales bacterium]|jgi:DNA-binding beta-propeller fold protein YncE|nr:IPT/TIG domain-containing protein [Bacteroidales bacterium]
MNKSSSVKKSALRFARTAAACLCFCGFFSCDDKDGQEKGEAYNPSKPVVCNSFYPDSGIYQQQVMLTGENFGNDPSLIKVYFNHRQAPVIGTTPTRMYVLAPRMPGDTCIISVVIGNDSLQYAQTFRYKISVTVTTIAGTGEHQALTMGELSSSTLQPKFLCADYEGNIFVCNRQLSSEGDQNQILLKINEEENEVIKLGDFTGNALCADAETGIVTVPTEDEIRSFLSLDPRVGWAPKRKSMIFTSQIPSDLTGGWKHSMTVNPVDGYIYTRYYFGHIVKIHPVSYEAEIIYKTTGDANTFGLTFRPGEPNILYLIFAGGSDAQETGGTMANGIYTLDVSDPRDETFIRRNSMSIAGAHRDGPLENAQFNNPIQAFTDNDGNIYLADSYNHCIRRITPENMVETVLGIPGTPGFKDGGEKEALFRYPKGIAVMTAEDGSAVVYVADSGNARVRKLSIN